MDVLKSGGETIDFLTFIDLNLKIQKCLLPDFDISNAFISALNDWMKEILECYQYKELYQEVVGDYKEALYKKLELYKN